VVNVTKGTLELTTSTKVGRSRRRKFRRFLVSSKLADRVRRTTGKVETFQSKPESASAAGPTPKEPSEMRGFLSGGKLTLRSYFSLSNLDKTKAGEFLPFVVPVTTTAIGRISGYIAMSHVASSALGTYDMAAHQIVFSIFCCLTPFVDALNQVAQSFVPAVFEAQRRDEDRARALRRTVGNFRTVGAGFGAVLVGLAACIPRISGGFTTDAAVRRTVEGALPGVGAFLLVNGLMCAGEGCLLGQRDLGFLRNAYAAFFFFVPAYMLRLKYRALAGVQQVGVGTMWAAFGAYNIVRAGLWHLRLAQLQRRTDSEVEEVAIGS
jgi:Na+-driven multidrug efflux pump